MPKSNYKLSVDSANVTFTVIHSDSTSQTVQPTQAQIDTILANPTIVLHLVKLGITNAVKDCVAGVADGKVAVDKLQTKLNNIVAGQFHVRAAGNKEVERFHVIAQSYIKTFSLVPNIDLIWADYTAFADSVKRYLKASGFVETPDAMKVFEKLATDAGLLEHLKA